jgi:hypothetical protein
MTLVQYHLVKLAEEAAEVAQIALKAAHFGLSEIRPGKEETNAQRIYGELNDLNAMVHRLGEVSNGEFFFDIGSPDHVAIAKKLEKVAHFLAYSQSLGLVENPWSKDNATAMMESLESEIACELSSDESAQFNGHTVRIKEIHSTPGCARRGEWSVDGVVTEWADVFTKIVFDPKSVLS